MDFAKFPSLSEYTYKPDYEKQLKHYQAMLNNDPDSLHRDYWKNIIKNLKKMMEKKMKAIYYRVNGEKITSWEFSCLTVAKKQVSGDWIIVSKDETVTVMQLNPNDHAEPREIDSFVGELAISFNRACEDAGLFLEIRDN